MIRSLLFGIACAVLLLAPDRPAGAVPISSMVGDDDGYGMGIPDNGSTAWSCCFDNRSPAEATATDGAQFTDLYSALFPGFGENPTPFGQVFLPFSGTLLSAVLTIDMADFEASWYGPILADVNGVSLPFAFDDGFRNTVVRSWLLTPSMLAAANAAGQVILTFDRAGSGDFIAFDYFRLDGEVREAPEPGTLALLAAGLLGMGLAPRRRRL